MAKFEKVFDLDNDEQVLVTLEFQETENSEEYNVKVTTSLEGVTISNTYGYNEEEAQLKVFHGYSKKDALKFREATVEIFS